MNSNNYKSCHYQDYVTNVIYSSHLIHYRIKTNTRIINHISPITLNTPPNSHELIQLYHHPKTRSYKRNNVLYLQPTTLEWGIISLLELDYHPNTFANDMLPVLPVLLILKSVRYKNIMYTSSSITCYCYNHNNPIGGKEH